MKSKDLYQQEKKSHWFIEGQIGWGNNGSMCCFERPKMQSNKKDNVKEEKGPW